MSRFCLALCLALTLACNASAVEQRLHILQALQGVLASHVPQMLMTHDRPGGHELPVLDALLLPTLVALLGAPSSEVSETEFVSSAPFCAPRFHRRQLRGPPASSVLARPHPE